MVWYHIAIHTDTCKKYWQILIRVMHEFKSFVHIIISKGLSTLGCGSNWIHAALVEIQPNAHRIRIVCVLTCNVECALYYRVRVCKPWPPSTRQHTSCIRKKHFCTRSRHQDCRSRLSCAILRYRWRSL